MQAPWAGVPDAYRQLPVGRFSLPGNAADWIRERESVSSIVIGSLGDRPPRPPIPAVRTVWRKQARGFTIEKFTFQNCVDSVVPGYIAIPLGITKPGPAVLAIHGHGGSKEGIFGRISSQQNVAERLAARGFVVMAIDNYFSGERRGSGPDGPNASPSTEESSLFKLNLWLGRTLWGMMLRDQQMALDYLVSRPEVDPARIGTQGMSMGSTAAWWLAAIDERVKAVVGAACFTRYQDLIATRGLPQHGIYYYVPGLLRAFDTEGVMSLIAPRPFLAMTGDRDAGSPPKGVRTLEEVLSRCYALYGKPDRFNSVILPNTGHVYSELMKQKMLAWFELFL
ncbi:MAG: alpha/beta hydrolase family protein [Candidatus Solibacter sp.]